MNTKLTKERIEELITFLSKIKINTLRFVEISKAKDIAKLTIINEALTHSSANKNTNHEKLEFYGDAVLRLSASEFIDKTYKSMSVGKRSELRAQIVSDNWLANLGKEIKIENFILVGPKALGDNFSKETIIAETTEAFIGALYRCFNSIHELNIWLDQYWKDDCEILLNAPYKFNAKSTLQEWCQEKGLNLPEYKIKQISSVHGDPKRFYCELYISGIKRAESFGQSHKKAEKNAALIAIEKIFNKI